jgi:glycosyltransferase involved in cell wall biosynthesis
MKILLIGEYSRLHNSLKEGLESLNHEVTIVGTGDKFKNFPVDLSIAPKIISSNLVLAYLNKITLRAFKFNLESIEKGIRFYFILPQLQNYDVVQLINSNAIETFPRWSMYLLRKVFSKNHKIFLLICGEETPIIAILLKNNLKYSILTPYFTNPKLKSQYDYSLKYVTKPYKKLYEFVSTHSRGILVSDLDYKIPMAQTQTNFTFIPNPINTDTIEFSPNSINDEIVIFHGVNKYSSVKKGNSFFDEALIKIEEKYPAKVKVITATSLPYKDYQKAYGAAHIVLDQVYSFDQGYNALEAMAKGKVVFTGAETAFTEHYNLSEKVAINALPDVDYLVNELSHLIENPQEIVAIGNRARVFIEREHHYVNVANKYLEFWKK